ncbi:MAG: M1 family aminopeptidase [Bacteroidales bacterium]|nr:M1 family aminopeptidase [Bacteroidales bacterium]
MKKLALLLICILPLRLFSQDPDLCWIDQDAQAKASRMKVLSALKGMHSLSAPSGMDIKYHRLELTLDPAVRQVTGKVTTFFAQKTNDHHTLSFDLRDNMIVTAIRFGNQLIINYIHQNNRLTIPISGLPIGLTDSITVEYHGVPVNDGSDSFSLSQHAGAPILYTLSEPYGAKDWWPCSQDLNDKIDSVDLIITVPPGNRAAANGMLISEEHLPDRSIYHWKHKHPIAAYLVGVSVTNYVYYSDYAPIGNNDSIEILNYVYPESLAYARAHTPGIILPFQHYCQWFGLYPFADERYGHAQWNWGGGMEHQTMSFMGDFGYDLMAHELAHQWYGDYLTCGSWRDIWLNEGFATYLVGLCYEVDMDGMYWEPFKRLTINRVIGQPGGSVYCYDTTNVNRVFDSRLSYSKGGIVLHMLRGQMGDSDFFKAMNEYLHDPGHAAGYATTEDFISHVNAVSDSSYQEFFNDWVYGGGYPTYHITYRVNGDHSVELEISQETSDPSVNFFEMKVPLRFYGPSGQTRTIMVHHTQNGQVFRVDPGFKTDSIKFDPDRWICTANPLVSNIAELPYDQQINVFPNPVTDLLTVHLTLPEAGICIRIYNAKGQKVGDFKTSYSTTEVHIPMVSYPAGVYSVEVVGRKPVKILKQ